MRINANFSERAIVAPSQYRWAASPQGGVERVMLDRVGTEQARATSIVRYAPDSRFPSHPHPGGEEILVLSGTFSEGDEHYPAGWYLRNPSSYTHAPYSREGALIFVKLRQMPSREQRRVRIDTSDPAAWRHRNGDDVCPLFSGDAEQVWLQRLAPHDYLRLDAAGGAELLVLDGSMVLGGQHHARGSWMRFPPGDVPELVAGTHGATVYLKTGHLADVVTGE